MCVGVLFFYFKLVSVINSSHMRFLGKPSFCCSFLFLKKKICTYQSVHSTYLIYGKDPTFLYTAFSYSELAVKTNACLSVSINAQWMNMTLHFSQMPPGSVVKKCSKFRLNYSTLGLDLREVAWREYVGAL